MSKVAVCILLTLCISGILASNRRAKRQYPNLGGLGSSLGQSAQDLMNQAQDLAHQMQQHVPDLTQGALDLAYQMQQHVPYLTQGAQDLVNHAQDLANHALHSLGNDTGEGLGQLAGLLSDPNIQQLLSGSANATQLMSDPQFQQQLQSLDPTAPDYIQKVGQLIDNRLNGLSGSGNGITASLVMLLVAIVAQKVLFV